MLLFMLSVGLFQSACWAMAKSWLDVQVDIQIARLQRRGDQFKSFEEAIERSPGQGDLVSQPSGPDNWPLHVLNQQPMNFSSLLQKLHSRFTCHINGIHFSLLLTTDIVYCVHLRCV